MKGEHGMTLGDMVPSALCILGLRFPHLWVTLGLLCEKWEFQVAVIQV